MSEKLYISPNASSFDNKNAVIEGLKILVNAFGQPERVHEKDEATYYIIHSTDISEYDQYREMVVRGGTKKKFYVIFNNYEDFKYWFNQLDNSKGYNWIWKWYDNYGYEVTSKGDRRFSPFCQYINTEHGYINLEDYYHKYIKPAKENGTYVEGTGHEIMKNYLFNRLGLLYELAYIGCHHAFSDMFDKNGGQNKWYAEILNEIKNGK